MEKKTTRAFLESVQTKFGEIFTETAAELLIGQEIHSHSEIYVGTSHIEQQFTFENGMELTAYHRIASVEEIENIEPDMDIEFDLFIEEKIDGKIIARVETTIDREDGYFLRVFVESGDYIDFHVGIDIASQTINGWMKEILGDGVSAK